MIFSNSELPDRKFPLHQQDLLNERGCCCLGKLIFQPTEPIARQPQ